MPFVTVNKASVNLFWRDYEARQEAKRTTTRKEPPMPVQKSLTDLAWEAFAAAARALVTAKTFRTYEEAVDALKAASHPAYLTYLASLSSSSTPPATPAPGDVVKVVKQAQDVQFAKKRQVQTEINKRVERLVKSGQAPDEQEALRAVFKSDPQLYEDYRQSSYAAGPLPDVQHDGPSVAPDAPALAMAKRLALQMRADDPYGQYNGKSEQDMLDVVFRANPALYEQNRQESYSRL